MIQDVDYLHDYSDLACPCCPECGGVVGVGELDGVACWECLCCGYKWLDEAEETESAR